MKLRQKLAAVLAATMVVTAVPVTTMAATTNRITKSLTVAKDAKIGGFTTTKSTYTVNNETIDGTKLDNKGSVPYLVIEEKDAIAGEEFYINIKEGEFADIQEYAKDQSETINAGGTNATVVRLNSKTLQVKVSPTFNGTELSIPMYASAKSGETVIEIDADGSSVSSGSFVIARTNEAKGTVTVADATTFFDAGTVANITVEEAYAGAFAAADNQVITLTIDHSDFKFEADANGVIGTAKLGRGFDGADDVNVVIDSKDNQVATVTLPKTAIEGKTARGSVEFKGIKVKSTTKNPSTGDFNIEVSGKLVEDKEYKVATVADFGTSLKMKDDKTVEVVAGQNKEIEFSLKENVDDSINTGRSVEVRLTEDAYFTTSSAIEMNGEKITSDKWIEEKIDGEKRVVGFETTLKAEANKRDEYKFKGTVVVPVDFTGDIKVTAEGRAIGEDLETVAITAKAPVEIETEAAVLKVGLKEQKAGKVVITETEKARLKKGKTLVFDLAKEDGMEFTGKPEVKVTAGDLQLGEFEIKDGKLIVEVKRESKEASTIEVTNFGIKLDRTVPQGKYDLKIGGEALVDAKNATKLTVEDFFIVGTPNTEDITNGMRKGTASFVNGATTYTVNGEAKEMDGAAYISKAGRMMLPVRYVSEAFGIEGNNVIFADGTVTILAGTRTLQVKNGSDIAVLNGAQIKMAEKIVIKDGRTYVPVGEVGRLLGVSVSFDDATKTATFENK